MPLRDCRDGAEGLAHALMAWSFAVWNLQTIRKGQRARTTDVREFGPYDVWNELCAYRATARDGQEFGVRNRVIGGYLVSHGFLSRHDSAGRANDGAGSHNRPRWSRWSRLDPRSAGGGPSSDWPGKLGHRDER